MKSLFITLILATHNGRVSPRLLGLIERQMPDIRIEVTNALALYRKRPDWPTPICDGIVFYKLQASGTLIASGCLDEWQPLAGMQTLLQRIK